MVSMAVRTEYNIRVGFWVRNTKPGKGIQNNNYVLAPQLETRMAMPNHFDRVKFTSFFDLFLKTSFNSSITGRI